MDASDISDSGQGSIKEFIRKIIPFSELGEDVLKVLSYQFAPASFPKNTVVLRQDVDEVNDIYLICRGAVKTYLTGPDGSVTLLDFRGEGGYFGALAIIRGSKANFNVETVEDTLCLVLKKEIFTDLISKNPHFANHYLRSFSEELVNTAFSEIRTRKNRGGSEETLNVFSCEVGEVINRPPEMIGASESIQLAAKKMAELEIGSLLVHNPAGEVIGIITDKDLSRKVIATGLDYRSEVSVVMSSPVRRITHNSLWFDALLQMMKDRVNHLVVERANRIVGVVSVKDLMMQAGSSPLHLSREIESRRTIEGLFPLSKKIPGVVRTLVEQGGRSDNITRIIALLNDQIVHRVLAMADDQLGPAPCPFCWITFGSEGRREQTFKTDQDNALIFETPRSDEDMKVAKRYFRKFADEVTAYLESCGYPLCPGSMMASNPRWRKPYVAWKKYFDSWMVSPEPREVLNATIFFDFRPCYGKMEYGVKLRDHLALQAPERGLFLLHLAKDCLSAKPPLSFFKNFIVEKDGVYKNHLDLKTHGMTPFVNFARLFSLRNGIKETNTLERLEQLAAKECIPKELFSEIVDAYEFQMQLRLVHQLRMIEANLPPNNHIDPTELSDLEKQTLKEAFAVIGRLQQYVKSEFRVVD